jgi:hypothetical protein
VLGLKLNEINAQPKVFHRDLLPSLQSPPLNFAFDLYALYHAQKRGMTFTEISVLFPPRVNGLSNWSATFFSRYKTILNMIKYMFALSKEEGRLK